MSSPLFDALVELLDRHQASYRLRHHPRSEFAQETAAILGVSGKQVAKAVLGVDPSDRPVLAVIPADRRVDWDRLSTVVGSAVKLASRDRTGQLTGLAAPGGLPPFGILFGCPTVVDPALGRHDTIACAAGTLTDSLVLSWEAYLAVAAATVAPITATESP